MYYKAINTVNQYTNSTLGRLQVRSVIESIGLPASGARVTIAGSDTPETIVTEITTDSSGVAPIVDLPAPPLEYSQSPDNPRPFNTYDISVTAPDLQPVRLRGVQVFPDTLSLATANMMPGNSQSEGSVITVADPTLWGDFPPKIPESDVKTGTPVSGLVVLENAVVPEYIVVHDGAPSDSSAPNYTVTFTDYIKNVACCEIYSTWPRSTITANVLAIISFTLNRVYTEWYRSQGYDFTITSSTAYDQAFDYGRNLFDEISGVVDETFSTYITREGIAQPLLTQYCDGINVTCPGWMTQWGSKDLGTRGYNAVDILRYYYGSDIYLATAPKVEGIPMSFGGATLQLGSTGTAVRTVQAQLNSIAANYPLIPRLVTDGIYGQNTRKAVETFQGIFNLPKSGLVDFATWYRISFIYVAVANLARA